jgi:hypothetical protein
MKYLYELFAWTLALSAMAAWLYFLAQIVQKVMI